MLTHEEFDFKDLLYRRLETWRRDLQKTRRCFLTALEVTKPRSQTFSRAALAETLRVRF